MRVRDDNIYTKKFVFPILLVVFLVPASMKLPLPFLYKKMVKTRSEIRHQSLSWLLFMLQSHCLATQVFSITAHCLTLEFVMQS